MSSSARVRDNYHHGDLRNALVDAAGDLASTGGPDSVTIRAAARSVGVTPTAAYRHFTGQEQLLEAAKEQALVRLAMAMEAELSVRPPTDDRLVAAVGKLAAIGRGYVNFAIAQSGLFRTAFACEGLGLPPGVPGADEPEFSANPFQTLVDVMDELVEVGYLSAERRPMAEFAAWSTVHGLAMLFLEGPLRDAEEDLREQALVRAMGIFVEGLGSESLSDDALATLGARSRSTG